MGLDATQTPITAAVAQRLTREWAVGTQLRRVEAKILAAAEQGHGHADVVVPYEAAYALAASLQARPRFFRVDESDADDENRRLRIRWL